MTEESAVFDRAAKWIGGAARYLGGKPGAPGSPALCFRRRFEAGPALGEARLVLCGLGLFEAKLNGVKVGDGVLEPPFTDYGKRVLYRVYEVGSLMRPGENLLEIVLGDGWFNQTTEDTWGFSHAPWRDTPKLRCQLTWEGGGVWSDENFLVAADGPIRSNALRLGETCDLTREPRDFSPALSVPPPGGRLELAGIAPMRECEALEPKKRTRIEGGILLDFGRNISGYCRVSVCARAGDRLTLTYAERLREGRPDNARNSLYLFNAQESEYQRDTLILAEGHNEWSPKFVYHGFRYVLLEGTRDAAERARVRALFVHTDLERVGEFHCSEGRLNALYEMSVNALLSNWAGIPTDCPHREKNGWTGDAQLSAEAMTANFHMEKAFKKFLRDIADTQLPTGQIAAIAPTSGWGYNWGAGPAWDFALFRLTERLLTCYGDEETAREMLPVCLSYLDYVSEYWEREGLVRFGLGDWNYPKEPAFPVAPVELTDSCYYLEMLRIAAGLCARMGHARAGELEEKARLVREAVLGKYGAEESMGGLAALCCFGIADRTERLVERIEKSDHRFLCGILGVKFVVTALGEAGRTDVLVRMLSKRDYPSFGYWMEEGQTSLCEDFELTNSLNHHMFSSVTECMTAYLCGVRQRGPRRFDVLPRVPAGLSSGSYSFRTEGGVLRSEFEVCGSRVVYRVTVPEGCRVRFGTGDGNLRELSPGRHFAETPLPESGEKF